MKTIQYPLIYYSFGAQGVLGILVGTDHQMLDRDLKSLKSALVSYVQKQYKKYDDYYYMDIVEPKFKVFEFGIRPTIRDRRGAFPYPNPIKIPLPVIYGETEHGYFECFLPLLKNSFYYYDARQFKSLLHFLTTDLLSRLSPNELHRLMRYPEPQLDFVSLKINTDRENLWTGPTYHRRFRTLERLAERYPYSKAVRKNISAFPDAAWELEYKVDELREKLVRQKNNLLIVGPPSVGKSAVLRQAIRKITNQGRSSKLSYSFWRMIPQRFTATAKYLGEWQEICDELIEDLTAANGILWVEDIVRLLQIGGGGPEDSVAAYLMAYLQQGKLQLVGEVSPQQLESMRRLLPGFTQLFQLVFIEELPETKIFAILQKFADFSQRNLKVRLNETSLLLAYRLLLRYYPYESFPGKAIKFLGLCISEAKLNSEAEVGKTAVIENFIRQTGLPPMLLRDDLLLDQSALNLFFQQRIIGQPEALRHMRNIVKIYKAGLNNPNKPVATLLFCGPTGVGKTASAKALADYFFGQGQQKSPLIRIDMSEFQYPGQIHRFIGYGKETGKLVQQIRERPFSVLLLDEVEKAHPSIFDALLSVLDEGMLVDAFGRVTNFKNSIIIMTSNLGATNRKSLGFRNTTSEEGKYFSAIHRFFRPEFINRIDELVLFHALSREDIRKITNKELQELALREGIDKLGLQLHFTERLVSHLVDIGFDESYGARPLQRAIENWVVHPLANWLLNHPEVKGEKLELDFEKRLIVRSYGD